MCKWHEGTFEGTLPVTLAHPRSDGVTVVYVDPCLQKMIQALNDGGIQTVASCCGHGIRPGLINLENGPTLVLAQYHSWVESMTRQFPTLDGSPLPTPTSAQACTA